MELPDDCAKQWEILLLLISAEEKKIDRTSDGEIDTMNYFYNNEGIRRILHQWLQQMKLSYAKKTDEADTALKSDEVALLWRQRGNDKFRANRVEDSYRCYTKSVLYAPQEGPMYPLALANRSASLLRMKRFQECLSDIKLSLASGYPNEQRHKLLLRRADCHMELGQRASALEALAASSQHAASLKLSPSQCAEFERHIRDLERKVEVIIDQEKSSDDVIPECYMGLNENFISASNAIELRRNDTFGRHVVARQAARRGDVLFSEEPYACVTLPGDPDDAVCDTCCRSSVNLVPCSTCSRSVYCGAECRARGAAVFHRWECVGAQADLFPTIGIAHLALRVLLVTAHEGFPKAPASEAEPRTAEELFHSYSRVDSVLIYKRDAPSFYRMFNLVTNFDKMNNADYIQYALTATMLTLYLDKFTSFFEYLPGRVPHALSGGQLRLLAAAIILRSLGQLVCNGHAALSLATIHQHGRDGRTVLEREVRRATAIYPSAAMMNHSCDPNIINTFHNSRLIVRCARELAAGAEVHNCYGPHRARDVTAQRRSQLRAQYMFTCTCTACTDTERRDFVSLFSAYACQACKGPVVWSGRRAHCPQCRADLQLAKALTTVERADELMAQAERAAGAEERCEKAHASFKLKQQVLHRHHTALRASADRLARIYADIGEFSKSVELIKQNIQSLEYQFGSFSVEVAHELRKLSDVMLERLVNAPQHPDCSPAWPSAEHATALPSRHRSRVQARGRHSGPVRVGGPHIQNQICMKSRYSHNVFLRILNNRTKFVNREWCLEAHKIIKKAVQLMELNYGSWEPLVKRLKEQEAVVGSMLAHSRTPETANNIHHNLHYNLKI